MKEKKMFKNSKTFPLNCLLIEWNLFGQQIALILFSRIYVKLSCSFTPLSAYKLYNQCIKMKRKFLKQMQWIIERNHWLPTKEKRSICFYFFFMLWIILCTVFKIHTQMVFQANVHSRFHRSNIYIYILRSNFERRKTNSLRKKA